MEQSCRHSVLTLCQYCEVGSSWTTTQALLLHCNNIRSLGYISLLHPTTTLLHEEQEEEAEETASSLLLLRTKTHRVLLCFPPCRADRQRPRGGGSPSSPHTPSRSLVVSQANEKDSDRKNQFPSSLLHIPDTCSEPPKRVRGSSSSQNHSPYFPYTWATTSNNLSSCGNFFPICKRKQKAPAGSTTHLPHSLISGWLAQQSPPLLPSFDSNPLTKTASKDKKSPAKDDQAKSLQKSKKIQTHATVLDLWSKEEHKLLQGAVNWKLLCFSYATQNSETLGGGENHPRSYKKDCGKRFPDAIPVQMRGICKGTERARARARAHERRDRRERASLTRGRERVPATFLHYGHWPTGHGAGGAPYVEWPWPWPLIDQLSIVYCFFWMDFDSRGEGGGGGKFGQICNHNDQC